VVRRYQLMIVIIQAGMPDRTPGISPQSPALGDMPDIGTHTHQMTSQDLQKQQDILVRLGISGHQNRIQLPSINPVQSHKYGEHPLSCVAGSPPVR